MGEHPKMFYINFGFHQSFWFLLPRHHELSTNRKHLNVLSCFYYFRYYSQFISNMLYNLNNVSYHVSDTRVKLYYVFSKSDNEGIYKSNGNERIFQVLIYLF